jgi:hypothetical protein
MLGELDVLVFVKSADDLSKAAERVFASLRTEPVPATMEEPAGLPFFEGQGLGFSATFFANSGDLLDPEFENYDYTLQINSDFWDIELDPLDLESALSEFYARKLAFELNVETATEIFVESTEDAEVFEIRSFRRNSQYVPSAGPTIPRVYLTETRQVERAFDDEEWEDGAELEEGEEFGGNAEAEDSQTR